MEGQQPFAFLSGGYGLQPWRFRGTIGEVGEVFLFSYIKLEVVVFVQDVVAEKVIPSVESCLLISRRRACLSPEVGAGTDKFLMGFFQQPLLFGGQAESMFLAVDSIHFLEKLLVEGDVVFVLADVGASFMERAVSSSVVSASVRLKNTPPTRSRVGELLSRATMTFSKVGASVLSMMAWILAFCFSIPFWNAGSYVLQLDFIEWRHAIGCLKLSKERIAFRLGRTGVHHTTCC